MSKLVLDTKRNVAEQKYSKNISIRPNGDKLWIALFSASEDDSSYNFACLTYDQACDLAEFLDDSLSEMWSDSVEEMKNE